MTEPEIIFWPPAKQRSRWERLRRAVAWRFWRYLHRSRLYKAWWALTAPWRWQGWYERQRWYERQFEWVVDDIRELDSEVIETRYELDSLRDRIGEVEDSLGEAVRRGLIEDELDEAYDARFKAYSGEALS